MVEIFRQRAVYLTGKTWVLFWPLIVFVVLLSLQPLMKAWSPWVVIQPLLLVASVAVFFIYSYPRFRLFKIEELLWIKRYLRNNEVIPVEESHEFMQRNISRITSYKQYVWNRYFLIPMIICLIPIFGAVASVSLAGVTSGAVRVIVGYIFLYSILAVPLCGLFAIIYWLVTRDILRYVSISLIEALDGTEQLSNQQILKNATTMAHATKLKDTLRYVMEDFINGSVSSAPAGAIDAVSNLAPKPVAVVANTYAGAYSLNVYVLMNAIETYAMYLSVQSRINQRGG